ncbi:MAG: ribokinase [Actinomycetota bacterium]
MRRVVVVGSVNMDAVARVDRLPAPGETIGGAELAWFPGGKGANQAVAAARQGASAAFVGRVGDDDAGRSLVAGLAAEGVDVSAVGIASHAPTGLAMIAVDATGANTIVVAPGSNQALTPSDVDAAAVLDDAAVVVCQLEIPMPAVVRALERGRDAGAVTILNPSPWRPIDPSLLGLVDVIVANEHEAALLGEELSCPTIIVTMGARGAELTEGGVRTTFPSVEVHAVDTTAAGDAFCGTLAAAVAAGRTLPDAVTTAVVAGAIAVTRAGAQPSLPTAAEVAALLEESHR